MVQAYLDFLVVEKGLSANSISAYAADISRFLEFLESREMTSLDHVDITVILAWLVQLSREGLAPKSRARHLITIRGLYRFLVNEKYVPVNPVQRGKHPQNRAAPPGNHHRCEVAACWISLTPPTQGAAQRRHAGSHVRGRTPGV